MFRFGSLYGCGEIPFAPKPDPVQFCLFFFDIFDSLGKDTRPTISNKLKNKKPGQLTGFLYCKLLFQKQHLSVFDQRPRLVVN